MQKSAGFSKETELTGSAEKEKVISSSQSEKFARMPEPPLAKLSLDGGIGLNHEMVKREREGELEQDLGEKEEGESDSME